MRRIIEIVAFVIALSITALAIHAWLASRSDQRELQSALAAQKQLIDAAGAREATRDATLQQTLAQIDALKRSTQTPAQILRDLPKYLALPTPIALSTAVPSSTARRQAKPPATNRQGTAFPSAASSDSSPTPLPLPNSHATLPSSTSSPNLPTSPSPNGASQAGASGPSAEIPSADLKPLYNYVQDCRACQARLAAATQNSADDAAKIAALTRERDAAVTASKGGSFWRQLRRNALWFAVGAGAGSALGYAAHR